MVIVKVVRPILIQIINRRNVSRTSAKEGRLLKRMAPAPCVNSLKFQDKTIKLASFQNVLIDKRSFQMALAKPVKITQLLIQKTRQNV